MTEMTSSMKHRIGRTLAGIVVMVAGSLQGAWSQGFHEQTITLQPGWNAVYFEVTPDPEDIDNVFAAVPVQSVWRFFPSPVGQVEITDPADGLLGVTGWTGYFPAPRPEAFLTNLFTVRGSTAYLVNLDSDTPVDLTVRGRPELLPQRWRPDDFNLVGFHVDPLDPPTFADYFADSPAHAGQPIFALNGDGVWETIDDPASTLIDPGRAYWVFTQGPSDFMGSLSVQLDLSKDMDFGREVQSLAITLENRSRFARQVTLRRLPGGDGLPLSFEIFDEETGETAAPVLPEVLNLDLGPESDRFLTLFPRRAEMTQDVMADTFVLEDGTGSRTLVYVSAGVAQAGVLPATPAKDGRNAVRAKALVSSYAGLWAGNVQVNGISESQQGGTEPKPVAQPFPLRFIIHIDSAGQARLLKEVIQMFQEGTQVPAADGSGLLEDETPGRFVLITDEDLLPSLTGAVVRDTTPVGIRFSTIAYDFPEQFKRFNESFDPLGTLTVDLVTAPEDPTNPFRHRYHPDHDNLDAAFLNPRQEAFEIRRQMSLTFTENDPDPRADQNPPGWQANVIGGTFREVITGLHRNPIVVAGIFRLQRISDVPTLNN